MLNKLQHLLRREAQQARKDISIPFQNEPDEPLDESNASNRFCRDPDLLFCHFIHSVLAAIDFDDLVDDFIAVVIECVEVDDALGFC